MVVYRLLAAELDRLPPPAPLGAVDEGMVAAVQSVLAGGGGFPGFEALMAAAGAATQPGKVSPEGEDGEVEGSATGTDLGGHPGPPPVDFGPPRT